MIPAQKPFPHEPHQYWAYVVRGENLDEVGHSDIGRNLNRWAC
jgi:hypothetical protein